MNDQDLESRVRSYYRTLDATDSSRLVSTSQVLLEDARRPRPRRLIWGSWRLAGSIAGAALLAAVLVLPRLAGPGGSVGSVGSAGSVAATGSPIPTPNPSVAATIAGPAPASPAATPLDAAGAVAAVEKFLGRKLGPTQTTEPGVMAIGRVIQVTESLPPDGGVSAYVDVDSGRVVSILIVSAIPKTTSVKLTSAQAQTAAAAYLESHDIPTDGMTVTVTLQDRGEVKDYVVDWKLYANGVLLPDSRSVSLDPSNGVVYSMNDVREPARPSSVATPAASPKLTRDDAIRLATSVAGMSKPKVESAELKVTSVGDPNWPSRLVWSLQLSEVAPQGAVIAAWVYVDAVTGETTIVGRG